LTRQFPAAFTSIHARKLRQPHAVAGHESTRL
jgi:hypothetical protein